MFRSKKSPGNPTKRRRNPAESVPSHNKSPYFLSQKRGCERCGLEARRRKTTILGVRKETSLAKFAQFHLIAKKRSGTVTDERIEAHEHYLGRAVQFFGDRELSTLTVSDVREWMDWLQTLPNRRGGTLSGWTARGHLTALSNLYRRASSEEYVRPGFNPAAAILEKPQAPKHEAKWLEISDASLLLEAARLHKPKSESCALPFAYELIATFLLTGGRASEVYGLEVGDVSFDRSTVTFRPHKHRRLKTDGSARVVPLWPHLREVLNQYLATRPPSSLLFPSYRTGKEQMLTDCRKMLDAVGERAGWKKGEIRTKMFRHTYCATRLQTLDHGAPVSIYTVSRELGHSNTTMIEKVYAHLGDVRHRADVVEYRVEQHEKELGDRFEALRSLGETHAKGL